MYRPPSWPTSSEAFLAVPGALKVCDRGLQIRALVHSLLLTILRGMLARGGFLACSRSLALGRSIGLYLYEIVMDLLLSCVGSHLPTHMSTELLVIHEVVKNQNNSKAYFANLRCLCLLLGILDGWFLHKRRSPLLRRICQLPQARLRGSESCTRHLPSKTVASNGLQDQTTMANTFYSHTIVRMIACF
jgi:hypothetical protein